MNHTHEKLHHSTWFYILGSSTVFITMSKFIPAFGLILAPVYVWVLVSVIRASLVKNVLAVAAVGGVWLLVAVTCAAGAPTFFASLLVRAVKVPQLAMLGLAAGLGVFFTMQRLCRGSGSWTGTTFQAVISAAASRLVGVSRGGEMVAPPTRLPLCEVLVHGRAWFVLIHSLLMIPLAVLNFPLALVSTCLVILTLCLFPLWSGLAPRALWIATTGPWTWVWFYQTLLASRAMDSAFPCLAPVYNFHLDTSYGSLARAILLPAARLLDTLECLVSAGSEHVFSELVPFILVFGYLSGLVWTVILLLLVPRNLPGRGDQTSKGSDNDSDDIAEVTRKTIKQD